MMLKAYTIDPIGQDWDRLLAGWSSILPSCFEVALVSCFGDVFIVPEDHSVHMLDIGGARLDRVAGSTAEFGESVLQNVDEWLLPKLVDECLAAGLVLGPNELYGYRIPPFLGGDYSVENIEVTNIVLHYDLLGDIFEQTRDLPDGTPIERVIIK
jgi:hypothetical protein